MKVTALPALLLAALLLVGALPAQEMPSNPNSCVSCHRQPDTIRSFPAWRQDEFLHWYGSVHGENRVTCDKCHGGDPTAEDKAAAHRGVGSSDRADSAVFYKNLPETCGGCHQQVYERFSHSRHFLGLKADRLAPTCTTCHGFEMDIARANPDRIVARCAICHNERQDIHPEVARQVREVVDGIARAEQDVQRADAAVALAREIGAAVQAAEEPLAEARRRLRATGGLWHQFALEAFAAELRKVSELAEKAYADARSALVSR